MRVLGVVPQKLDTSPGQRFRIEQWLPYLEREGIEIVFEPFESEELRLALHEPGRSAEKMLLIGRALGNRLQTLRQAKGDFDCAYVYREGSMVGPALDRWFSVLNLPYVYDFDDAIYIPIKSPTNGFLSLLKNPTKTRVSCRHAAHIMAGNRYLADYARQYNENVSVVPCTIDLSKYQVEPLDVVPDDDRLVIGWSGSHSTAQYLETISDALRQLAREREFKLLVIGAPRDFRIEGVDAEVLPWRSASEVRDLRRMHIGVMPLPDDRWAKGKCGLKLLQYMGLGIPGVASPVGVNSEIIDHGTNGFLATSQDEWVSRLRELLDSDELRRKFSAEGRKTVEDRFNGEAEAHRVASIFKGIVAAGT